MSAGWANGSDTRWRTFRASILARDHYLCRINGPGCTTTAPLQGGHVDHIMPLAMGGAKYDPLNCRAACETCNTSRRVKVAEEPEPRRVSNW